MAELQSSLPLIDLPQGGQIVFEAIDASTGAPVDGVTVANIAITVPADMAPREAAPLPAALAFEPTV